jgi:polysaccharide export outer membrane protein
MFTSKSTVIGLFILFCSCIGPIHVIASQLDRPQSLGSGDLISIYSSSHSQLNKKYTIDERGEITLPLVGRIKLGDLTIKQAERHITARLSSHFRGLSRIRIVVETYKKYIWIKGWVVEPGRYHLGWNDSLDILLRMAKGAKPGARLDLLWIHAPGRTATRYDLAAYYRNGSKPMLPQLPRNTIVFVPASPDQTPEVGTQTPHLHTLASRVAIFGAVQKPGIYPCFSSINLLQALALAGGPRTPAGLEEILIAPPNQPVRWFDLTEYLMGKRTQALPSIAPGSAIYIPDQALGVSRRGPIRIIGSITQPGVIHGTRVRSFSSLLAMRGGPTNEANLHAVQVVYRGPNFTISQEVDVKNALAEGRLDRLPPTPPGPMIVYIPSRRQPDPVLMDTQNIIQIVLAVASVVTSTIVLVVTLSNVNPNR